VIPHQAKFCPKCGEARPASLDDSLRPRMAAGAVPSTSPMPTIGKVFFVSILVGVGLIASGLVCGIGSLIYGGIAVRGAVLVVSLIGHHVT
jgi:hypothetical protein